MSIPLWYLLLPMAIGGLIGAAIVWWAVASSGRPRGKP